jgi:hypothetical protein
MVRVPKVRCCPNEAWQVCSDRQVMDPVRQRREIDKGLAYGAPLLRILPQVTVGQRTLDVRPGHLVYYRGVYDGALNVSG